MQMQLQSTKKQAILSFMRAPTSVLFCYSQGLHFSFLYFFFPDVMFYVDFGVFGAKSPVIYEHTFSYSAGYRK